jgi:hypothetical protein
MNSSVGVKPNQQHQMAIAKAHIVIKNFPSGTSAEELADFLYEKLGLDVKPTEEINIVNHVAFVKFRRETLAAFLGRYLEGVPFGGRDLIVEAKEPQKRGRLAHRFAFEEAESSDQAERWKRKL